MAGNSWQMPVAGEPSWGSPHTHVETIINVDPGSTAGSPATVTVTNVPTGTMAIAGYFEMISSTTTGRTATITDMSDNVWVEVRNATTAIAGRSWFAVPLNSSKQFKYTWNSSDVSNISIYLRTYFI